MEIQRRAENANGNKSKLAAADRSISLTRSVQSIRPSVSFLKERLLKEGSSVRKSMFLSLPLSLLVTFSFSLLFLSLCFSIFLSLSLSFSLSRSLSSTTFSLPLPPYLSPFPSLFFSLFSLPVCMCVDCSRSTCQASFAAAHFDQSFRYSPQLFSECFFLSPFDVFLVGCRLLQSTILPFVYLFDTAIPFHTSTRAGPRQASSVTFSAYFVNGRTTALSNTFLSTTLRKRRRRILFCLWRTSEE